MKRLTPMVMLAALAGCEGLYPLDRAPAADYPATCESQVYADPTVRDLLAKSAGSGNFALTNVENLRYYAKLDAAHRCEVQRGLGNARRWSRAPPQSLSDQVAQRLCQRQLTQIDDDIAGARAAAFAAGCAWFRKPQLTIRGRIRTGGIEHLQPGTATHGDGLVWPTDRSGTAAPLPPDRAARAGDAIRSGRCPPGTWPGCRASCRSAAGRSSLPCDAAPRGPRCSPCPARAAITNSPRSAVVTARCASGPNSLRRCGIRPNSLACAAASISGSSRRDGCLVIVGPALAGQHGRYAVVQRSQAPRLRAGPSIPAAGSASAGTGRGGRPARPARPGRSGRKAGTHAPR